MASSCREFHSFYLRNRVLLMRADAVFEYTCRGYTRDVTIQDNEIVWTAFSPIASWGYVNGFDGTDGQQPRDTRVLRNYVHEWGFQEIQSSMWSNNLACLSHLENNIAFNAPRAGDPCLRQRLSNHSMHPLN